MRREKKHSAQPGRYTPVLADIGERLKQLREQKGYDSIKEFAVDFNLPPIQYWRIEKGKTNLTIKSLNRLLAIHRLTVEEFFCGNDES